EPGARASAGALYPLSGISSSGPSRNRTKGEQSALRREGCQSAVATAAHAHGRMRSRGCRFTLRVPSATSLSSLAACPLRRLMQSRALYTNSTTDRTALSFFVRHACRAAARLACPFFTTVEPLTILREAGASEIRLIVRLCYATMPDALESAAALP